jgi:hypothetical protein
MESRNTITTVGNLLALIANMREANQPLEPADLANRLHRILLILSTTGVDTEKLRVPTDDPGDCSFSIPASVWPKLIDNQIYTLLTLTTVSRVNGHLVSGLAKLPIIRALSGARQINEVVLAYHHNPKAVDALRKCTALPVAEAAA